MNQGTRSKTVTEDGRSFGRLGVNEDLFGLLGWVEMDFGDEHRSC